MLPTVWGPPLWRIMTCVAFKSDLVRDTNVLPYTIQFYKSLAFLLPCKYCRQSYQKYITELNPSNYLKPDPETHTRQLVRWVWELKEKVNNKLDMQNQMYGKSQERVKRLSYPEFQKRINLATCICSPDDVLDFLSILALNYDPESHLKKKYSMIFSAVLPLVLPIPELNNLLLRMQIRLENLTSKQSYMDYVYK